MSSDQTTPVQASDQSLNEGLLNVYLDCTSDDAAAAAAADDQPTIDHVAESSLPPPPPARGAPPAPLIIPAGTVVTRRLTKDDLWRQAHFRRIVNAFHSYRNHSMEKLIRTEAYLKSLPERHRKYLSKYGRHLDKVGAAIEQNYEILRKTLLTEVFGNLDWTNLNAQTCHSAEVAFESSEKVSWEMQNILKHFVRDWSAEGADERKACYEPILDQVEKLFPPNKCNIKAIRVLVPGSGLGRLAYEIAKRGYQCQRNDFSFFMGIAANFVLNWCRSVDMYEFYPWTHQYSNNVKSEDQVRIVTFPDVNPGQLGENIHFSSRSGDFPKVYTEVDAWDCAATCFFLDTAKNVIEYVETIWKILKPGGYWINLGPLLYHFADEVSPEIIQPSAQDILEILKECGFQLQGDVDYNVLSTYTHNKLSMMKIKYKSFFFTCRKPPVEDLASQS